MSSVYKTRIALIVVLAFAVLPCHYLLSQASPQTSKSPNDKKPTDHPAIENQWRLTPTDIQSQNDEVDPGLRNARNAYWQPRLQRLREMEGNDVMGPPEGYASDDVAEIPNIPGSLWVIATFDHYKVISIDPGMKLLYTEVSFRVDQIIQQPQASLLAISAFFDVDYPGGTVKIPGGTTVSWRI